MTGHTLGYIAFAAYCVGTALFLLAFAKAAGDADARDQAARRLADAHTIINEGD